MDVDALAAACAAGRVPRLIYTIPNFQNPSGATISAREAAAPLVEVCERHDILILEDDPYGKLRFEGEPLPGLAELARRGPRHLHVVVLQDRRAGPAGGLPGVARRDRRAPRGRRLAHLHLAGPARRRPRSTS